MLRWPGSIGNGAIDDDVAIAGESEACGLAEERLAPPMVKALPARLTEMGRNDGVGDVFCMIAAKGKCADVPLASVRVRQRTRSRLCR